MKILNISLVAFVVSAHLSALASEPQSTRQKFIDLYASGKSSSKAELFNGEATVLLKSHACLDANQDDIIDFNFGGLPLADGGANSGKGYVIDWIVPEGMYRGTASEYSNYLEDIKKGIGDVIESQPYRAVTITETNAGLNIRVPRKDGSAYEGQLVKLASGQFSTYLSDGQPEKVFGNMICVFDIVKASAAGHGVEKGK